MNPNQIEELISAALPGAQVRVRSEDNVHYEATVVALSLIHISEPTRPY